MSTRARERCGSGRRQSTQPPSCRRTTLAITRRPAPARSRRWGGRACCRATACAPRPRTRRCPTSPATAADISSAQAGKPPKRPLAPCLSVRNETAETRGVGSPGPSGRRIWTMHGGVRWLISPRLSAKATTTPWCCRAMRCRCHRSGGRRRRGRRSGRGRRRRWLMSPRGGPPRATSTRW